MPVLDTPLARSIESALTTILPDDAVATLTVLPLNESPSPATNVDVPVNWVNVIASVFTT